MSKKEIEINIYKYTPIENMLYKGDDEAITYEYNVDYMVDVDYEKVRKGLGVDADNKTIDAILSEAIDIKTTNVLQVVE